MSWKHIVIGVCMFFVGGIVGTLVTSYSLSNTKKNFQSGTIASESAIDKTSQNYQAGFADAKKLVEESSLGAMFKTPDDIRSLTGTVTATNKDNFILHLQSGNPFDDPALADRTVLITASTTVMNRIQKDPAVYKDEVANFLKKPRGTTTAVLPEEYTSTPVKASDIKVGDMVSVTASFGIKLVKEFDVTAIQILPNTPSL